MTSLLPNDHPIRYRPRMGEPTCIIEVILQWIWRWRAELMILYIALAITATLIYEGVK